MTYKFHIGMKILTALQTFMREIHKLVDFGVVLSSGSFLLTYCVVCSAANATSLILQCQYGLFCARAFHELNQ